MPWQAVGPPSGSPLEPLVRRVFSDGGESKVATAPLVALVMGAAGFGPFGLNPCLPGLYTWGVGYTGASTHWFGTYKDSTVRKSALGREGKHLPQPVGPSLCPWLILATPNLHHHPNSSILLSHPSHSQDPL